MNRRETLKGLAALTTLFLIPRIASSRLAQRPKLHFVGLGTGGTNVIYRMLQKQIPGNYTAITRFPSFIEPYRGINLIEYEYPRKFRYCNESGKRNMPLTDEMKMALSEGAFYILICGLGGFTGTSLISDALETLESNGKDYVAICTLPFKNEGSYRNNYSLGKKSELIKFKQVRYYDHKITLRKYGDLPVSVAFKSADDEIFRIIEQKILNYTSF